MERADIFNKVCEIASDVLGVAAEAVSYTHLNLAGVDTVLVKPQTTVDLWYTQIFRIFERRALRGLPCEE